MIQRQQRVEGCWASSLCVVHKSFTEKKICSSVDIIIVIEGYKMVTSFPPAPERSWFYEKPIYLSSEGERESFIVYTIYSFECWHNVSTSKKLWDKQERVQRQKKTRISIILEGQTSEKKRNEASKQAKNLKAWKVNVKTFSTQNRIGWRLD